MKKYNFDYYLLAVVAILVVIGIVVLSSVSAVLAQEKFGNTTFYLFHQIIYGILPGIIFGFVAFKINLLKIKKWAWLFVLIGLGLMGLVFVPGLGVVAGGASRWLGFGRVSFQPSEFLKITFIFYLAAWLASSRREHKNLKLGLIPLLVILGIIALFLIFQSNISTLGVIVISAAIMYFSAQTPFWHSILLFLIGLGVCSALIRLAPYRMKRLQVLLGLIKDPMGLGYQIKQILIAIGSGGLFGLGLGASCQKFGFLPQAMSDSVFAIIAEETGFVGCAVLIFLFLIFAWQGFKTAKKAQDKFLQLLAVGITSWICIQAFVNIGAMVGILPLTGIPLPFISYGGSHLVAELIGVGILLNISKKC